MFEWKLLTQATNLGYPASCQKKGPLGTSDQLSMKGVGNGEQDPAFEALRVKVNHLSLQVPTLIIIQQRIKK